MEAQTPLAIRKHVKLHQRFPSLKQYGPADYPAAGWVLFGRYIDAPQLDDICFFIGEDIEPLAGWNVGHYDVLLMEGELTPEIATICDALELDCVSIAGLPDLSKPGLAVFDMDSTAIQIECIDEIATLAGVGEQVAEVTERAMLGELDFKASLRERVATLKGADVSILEQVKATLPLMPEMRELVAGLHRMEWKVAIASGGFTVFSDHLKQELGLLHAESNQLGIENGKLTGEVIGDIVDAERKADILIQLAGEHDIEPENTIAVGDGANDLVMMAAAGFGIAYHAKPKVVEQAQAAIKYADLGGVMCILSAALLPQKLSWKTR